MRLLPALLVLIALSLTCVAPMYAGEAKNAAAQTIAVLRLEDAIRTSKLYVSKLDGLKKEKSDIETQLKTLEEQQKQLDSKLQVLSPTKEEYAKAQEESEVLKVRYKIIAERNSNALQRRHAEVLKACYTMLHEHLKEYCKDNNIGFVGLAPNGDQNAQGMPDLQLQLGLQCVLYYDATLDITEKFVAYSNGRFASEQTASDKTTSDKTAPDKTATDKPAGK